MADKKRLLLFCFVVIMGFGVPAYGELIQLLSDTTRYVGYNAEGIIDSALAKPKHVQNITVGGTQIPATAFKEVRLDNGTVVEMARVILISPEAPTKWKSFYNKLGASSDVVVIEKGSGQLDIVADGVHYVKYIVGADLDVDTNRDGSITPSGSTDEDGEDRFTKSKGAIILNNADRDGENDDPDNSDNTINGADDRLELSKLRLGGSGLDTIPSSIRFILEVNENDSENIRIFNGYASDSSEILGPGAGNTDRPGKKYVILDNNWLIGDAGKMLCAEALKYIGDPWNGDENDFDGKIEIGLVIQSNISGTWTDIGGDNVLFQVAPVVLAWNGQEVEEIYAGELEVFGTNPDLTPFIEALNPGVDVTTATQTRNIFCQDSFEVVNQYFTNRTIPVILDLGLPRHEDDNENIDECPHDLFEDNEIYAYVGASIMGSESGNGGDLEVTPPNEKYPVGTIIHGSIYNMSLWEGSTTKTGRFLKSQKVQTNNTIHIGTQWLAVGHVDEIICFAPNNDSYTLIVPDPKWAVDMLHWIYDLGLGSDYDIKLGAGKPSGDSEYVLEPDTKNITEWLVKKRSGDFISSELSSNIGNTYEDDVIPVNNILVFTPGDILRVDNEYIEIISVNVTEQTLTVWRNMQDPDGGQDRMDGISLLQSHTSGSKIYAMNDYILYNVYRTGGIGNSCPVNKIKNSISTIKGKFDQEILTIKVPVLFYQGYAISPNVVNNLICNGKAYMVKPTGPVNDDGVNQFERRTTTLLEGNTSLTAGYIEDDFVWEHLHMQDGSIHCATNTRRKPLETLWTEAWK